MTSTTRKFCLTLTEDLIKVIKKKAREKFGSRKGHISMFVEMVLRNEFHLAHPFAEEE